MSNRSVALRKKRAKINKIRKNSGAKRYEVFLNRTTFHIAAYLYDKVEKKCLVGACTSAKSFISEIKNINNGTVAVSKSFGSFFSKKIGALNIKFDSIYFNRGEYLFHGRVKAFYEGCFGENL